MTTTPGWTARAKRRPTTKGRFEFAVNMKADVKTYYWLSVKATATAPDGETHDANQTAYVNTDREQPTQKTADDRHDHGA